MISFDSKITQKVLSYFLLNPDTELYLNEMARKFDVDRGNLTRKLAEWMKEGILVKRQRGNLSLYKINQKYPLINEMKKIVGKSFGAEKEISKALKDIDGLKNAIIFGSYAKNEMNMESDIDLLLVGSHSYLMVQKEIVKLQKKLGREINVIDMTEQEFAKEKDNELLKNIFTQKFIQII